MDLMDLIAKRTKILHSGIWMEKQVRTIINDNTLRVSREIVDVAKERFAKRKAENPTLFEGNVFCLDLLNSKIGSSSLVLVVAGSIKYSVFDAIRKENIEKLGWKNFPIGTGVCSTVITSDLKILMHRTYAHVDFPNKIGVVGGVYDVSTPFDCIRQELEEEVGIKKEKIKGMRSLGISNRIEERINYELNFYTKVNLASNQISKLAQGAKDQGGEVFFLDCLPKALKEYLEENHKKIISEHFTCLVLLGRHLWGKKWSEMTNWDRMEK